MRIEAKTTSGKSFSVTREMIEKLESHSLQAGEVPAIVVEFLVKGKPVAEVAIVPTYALAKIVDV
jgi:Holliday junction resolvase